MGRVHHYMAEVIMENQLRCWMRSATPLAVARARRYFLGLSSATT